MITSFSGKHRFLSNFYPCEIDYEGIRYPSVEHAYQAAKTLDPKKRRLISQAEHPGTAKRMGNSVPLRPMWDEIKINVMEQLLRLKFDENRNRDLAHALILTHPHRLIEGNDWGDEIWGATRQGDKWRGKNILGQLLMHVRNDLLDSHMEVS